MNILEEMYFGNYRPNERIHTEDSEYAFVAENIDRILRELGATLSNKKAAESPATEVFLVCFCYLDLWPDHLSCASCKKLVASSKLSKYLFGMMCAIV